MPGTPRDIPYLEDKFQTGDIPTQQDFQDLFASFVHYLKITNVQGTDTTLVMSQKGLNDAIIALKDGVPGTADTFNKLFNLITGIGQFAGNHNASGGLVPTVGSGQSGAINKGDYWIITAPGGTISGIDGDDALQPNDIIYAKVTGATIPNQFFGVNSNVDLATSTVMGLVKLVQNITSNASDAAISQAGAKALYDDLINKINIGGMGLC